MGGATHETSIRAGPPDTKNDRTRITAVLVAKNWPPCWPILYHDIDAEIPAGFRISVKRAYWSFLVCLCVAVWIMPAMLAICNQSVILVSLHFKALFDSVHNLRVGTKLCHNLIFGHTSSRSVVLQLLMITLVFNFLAVTLSLIKDANIIGWLFAGEH